MTVKSSLTKSLTRQHNLPALFALSNSSGTLNLEILQQLIHEAPDPETALRTVLSLINTSSVALTRKWRELIIDLWSNEHPHVPLLLDLPIASADVSEVLAVQDALAFLASVSERPPQIVKENGEQLLNPAHAHRIASSLPSYASRPLLPLENEWQFQQVRRLRATLTALRLVRAVKGQLVIVKSRYQRFLALPTIQQYYLLWHAEVYHIDWAPFAGIWGEYIKVVQEYSSLLWTLNEGVLPDMPQDLRQWNQEVWDIFYGLWEDEGLLARQSGQAALLTLVRLHSLPNAITQIVMKDLLERYGLVYGEGQRFAYTTLGIDLLSSERGEDLPCSLDLLG